MADLFGALPFPVAAPAAGECAGDKALSIVASYLTAAIRAACQTAWASSGVCPGRRVVERAYTHDPKKLFDDSRLPGLYVWELNSAAEFLCSDILEDKRKLNIFWVMEGSQEEHFKARSPIVNAIGKAIQRAIHRGRDPSWVVAGDTDPLAVTLGSLFMVHAGISRITRAVATPQELEVYLTDGEGRPRGFPGLALSLDIRELLTFEADSTTFDTALDATLANTNDEELGSVEDGL